MQRVTLAERGENVIGKRKKPNKKRRKATRKATPRRPHKIGRPIAGTVDWTEVFLSALLDGLHVRDACKEAIVDTKVAYRRRKANEAFRLAWQEAIEIGTDELAAEAARRAYHGLLKPVFHAGEICGHIREYSDSLLMFLLRARDPGKYRESHKVEHTGPSGGAIPIRIVGINIIMPPESPDEEV
jgi:hypothetical protein